MISVNIDPISMKKFKSELDDLVKTMGSQDLNMYRAKKYRDFTVESVRSGKLNLRARSALTAHMMGEYDPMSVTGKLIQQMRTEPSGKNDAEAGYFEGGPVAPSISHEKLTYTQLAIIHHTGYRIPLKGEKGEKVRAWFAATYNVRFKKDKEWLIVPPRPFMFRALADYERQGLDLKATEEFLDKRFK